jgi:hypothetical protein
MSRGCTICQWQIVRRRTPRRAGRVGEGLALRTAARAKRSVRLRTGSSFFPVDCAARAARTAKPARRCRAGCPMSERRNQKEAPGDCVFRSAPGSRLPGGFAEATLSATHPATQSKAGLRHPWFRRSAQCAEPMCRRRTARIVRTALQVLSSGNRHDSGAPRSKADHQPRASQRRWPSRNVGWMEHVSCRRLT